MKEKLAIQKNFSLQLEKCSIGSSEKSKSSSWERKPPVPKFFKSKIPRIKLATVVEEEKIVAKTKLNLVKEFIPDFKP